MNLTSAMKIIKLHPDDVSARQSAAKEAAAVLRGGGVVVMPTETVYGLAASASSDEGINKLRQITGRSNAHVFTLHLPSTDAMKAYVGELDGEPARLITKALPGPITMAITLGHAEVDHHADALNLSPVVRTRLYDSGTISLRVPDDAVAQSVLSAAASDGPASPIVAVAAASGSAPPPTDAEQAMRSLGDGVDLVLDAGPTRHGKASTLVSVKRDRGHPGGHGNQGRWRVQLERAGVYDERFIRKLVRWTMLLVCSGNTCRSPMAEGLAKAMLAETWGVHADELERLGLRVISAGAATSPGAPASREAVALLGKRGIDLGSHRSRPLSVELIHEADVVYGMTQSHVNAALWMTPSASGKAFLLDDGDEIEDPIGAGAEAYRRTAEQIEKALTKRLQERGP